MGTGITSFSRTIARLDDTIAYFQNVDSKHCRRFFKVIMVLLMKRNSKERDYIGWSDVLLLLYASNQRPHDCMRMCTCLNARKPDLEIIASTIYRLAMFIVLL